MSVRTDRNRSKIPCVVRQLKLAPRGAVVGGTHHRPVVDREEEVAVGVENLQVQFGVDTDPPATGAARSANRGAIDRYVNPDDPMIDAASSAFIDGAAILAVRVWLRLRGEQVERGFIDNATYAYADRDFGVLNEGYRRVVVSKTM